MFDTFPPDWVWPLMAAPFVGSLMGVLITRLPERTPVFIARSACPACGARLQAIDLVPLLSFLSLRGRCRYCLDPISLFHPVVELAAIAVAAWAVLQGQDVGQIWIDCGLGWTLLTLAWIDWTSFLLPDVLTLPLLLAGLLVTLLWQSEDLTDHCVGAILGYLSFQAVGSTYRRLRGRDGLGGGDAKLIAAAGAWCGLAGLPLVMLASALIGLLAVSILALAGRTVTATTKIPFGPCIALAFWINWLYANDAGELIQFIARM